MKNLKEYLNVIYRKLLENDGHLLKEKLYLSIIRTIENNIWILTILEMDIKDTTGYFMLF